MTRPRLMISPLQRKISLPLNSKREIREEFDRRQKAAEAVVCVAMFASFLVLLWLPIAV